MGLKNEGNVLEPGVRNYDFRSTLGRSKQATELGQREGPGRVILSFWGKYLPREAILVLRQSCLEKLCVSGAGPRLRVWLWKWLR